MKISKGITLLLLSSLLFAEEGLYQDEELLSLPIKVSEEIPLNIREDNLSNFVALNSTIDENILVIAEEEVPHVMFNSYADALRIAKEKHKLVLLELVSLNCKFCEKMENEVLSKEKVQESIKKDFVLAQVNVDKEELPLGLSKQMTPMFVFVTENEDVADMRLGYIEEADFLLLLEKESKN